MKKLVAVASIVVLSFTGSVMVAPVASADQVCYEEDGHIKCRDNCSVVCQIGKLIGTLAAAISKCC